MSRQHAPSARLRSGAAKTMIERTEERFDLKPERHAADTAYGSGANLNWLVNDKKIAPHIPVIDKSKREDGTFSRVDFTFDKERNVYICPAGKTLTTGRLVNDGETLLYMASMRHCRGCLLKAQCCPKAPFRRVPRSIYEEARDVARALAKTEAFERSRHDRKRVETLFAHLKRILRLGRPVNRTRRDGGNDVNGPIADDRFVWPDGLSAASWRFSNGKARNSVEASRSIGCSSDRRNVSPLLPVACHSCCGRVGSCGPPRRATQRA